MANFTSFNKHSRIVHQFKHRKNNKSVFNQFKITDNKSERNRKIKAQRSVLKKILKQGK